VLSVNSSKTITKGTEYNHTDGTDANERMQAPVFGDKASNGDIPFCWLMIGSGTTEYTLWTRTLTVSGTTISGSADTRLSIGRQLYSAIDGGTTNKVNRPVISYNPDNNVFLAVYGELKQANGTWYAQGRLYCRAFTTNGTSSAPSTVGTAVRIYAPNQAASQTDSAGNPNYGIATCYDPVYNRHHVFWSNNKGDVRVAHVATTTSSAPTYVLLDFGNDAHATTGQYVAAQWREFRELPFVKSIGTTNGGVGATVNKTVFIATDPSASNAYKGHIKSSWGGPYATSTSNITSGSYIGFASAAYSNGNTATVKTVGNTVTKSGLTPGAEYYLGKGGGLTTDSGDTGVVAGKAISTTKLLIKI